MLNNEFEKIVEDFVPPKEKLVSIREIINYFQDKEFPLALRTVTKYATLGLIPKPLHIGNKGYYEKDYIYSELNAIYILKAVFRLSLTEICNLARNDHSSLKEIVEVLHQILDDRMKRRGGKKRSTTKAAWLANDPDGRKMAEWYITKVAQGELPKDVLAEYKTGK